MPNSVSTVSHPSLPSVGIVCHLLQVVVVLGKVGACGQESPVAVCAIVGDRKRERAKRRDILVAGVEGIVDFEWNCCYSGFG